MADSYTYFSPNTSNFPPLTNFKKKHLPNSSFPYSSSIVATNLVALRAIETFPVFILLLYAPSFAFLIANKGRNANNREVVIQLYISSGAIAYTANPEAGNTVPLLLSNFNCAGSEANLTSCLYDSNPGDCTLVEPAAGVVCNMTLRT